MSDDKLEHKVRIALRAAQMKRKIVPALLIEIQQRIDELHEEYVGKKNDPGKGWCPIFEKGYESFHYYGMDNNGIKDYYKRHHEIVAFLEGVGIPDIKVIKLDQLYQDLKARGEFKEKSLTPPDNEYLRYEYRGSHFVHLPSGTLFHYECWHNKRELGENEVIGYPQAFDNLQATPWFHNQHPIFNTMNYKAKLFLICLEVGDLLESEPAKLLPP